MGNQEHQEQSTDLESEILSEEPPVLRNNWTYWTKYLTPTSIELMQ